MQQAKPDVVAAAVGGDDKKALRQQVGPSSQGQAGLDQQPAGLAGRLRPAARQSLRRLRHHLVPQADLPGVAEFVKRYQTAYPDTPMRVPGNVFYNGYMSTRELLRAIERAGSTNNIAVIKQLEGHKMPADDRMQHHDAWIDPNTHQMQQTIYLARAANQRDAGHGTTCSRSSPSAEARATCEDEGRRRGACKLEVSVRGKPADLRRLRAAAASQRSRRPGPRWQEASAEGVAGGIDPPRPPSRSESSMSSYAPHLFNGLTLGLLFAPDRARLHADRRGDGGDQPRARLAVRARRLFRLTPSPRRGCRGARRSATVAGCRLRRVPRRSLWRRSWWRRGLVLEV